MLSRKNMAAIARVALGYFALHAMAPSPALARNDLETVVNTDVTDAGRSFRQPTPEQPIRYAALVIGYQDFGVSMAGVKEPDTADVIQVMHAVLREQGFLLANENHPPEILIAYAWGTINQDMFQISGDTAQDPKINASAGQILRLMGAGKFKSLELGVGRTPFDQPVAGRRFLSAEAERILSFANEGVYIIGLTAYSYESAKKGEKTPLWRTRIMAPSLGFSLPKVLPQMIKVASPHIGRETTQPVFRDFKAEVLVGPTVVKETDVPDAPKK